MHLVLRSHASSVVPFLLERLALIIQLCVVLLFAWVWSSVAAEISGHNSLPWIVGRIACVGLVGLAAIAMLVWGVLGALALSDPNISIGTDPSFFIGTCTQFLLCSMLLSLCIFVFVKAVKARLVEDRDMLVFRVVLGAQAVLWLATVFQLANGVSRSFFLTLLEPIALLGEALLYLAMIGVFLAFFLRLHARDTSEPLLMQAQDNLGVDEPRYDY
jgi:hypothetical protein